MNGETEAKQGSSLLLTVISALALPVCYVLSWGPVGSLVQRWQIECRPVENAYYPIEWAVMHCPGAYEPLYWYWNRFAFLRPDPDSRARQLVYTLDPGMEGAESPIQSPEPNAVFADSDDFQNFVPGPEIEVTCQIQAINGARRHEDGEERKRELINTSENLRRIPKFGRNLGFSTRRHSRTSRNLKCRPRPAAGVSFEQERIRLSADYRRHSMNTICVICGIESGIAAK